MKKYITPIIIAVYFAYIIFTTEYEKTDLSLSYVFRALGNMPVEMVRGIILILLLTVLSVALYIYFAKAGDSDE